MKPSFHALRDLIDHEIVDATEMPCGMVDDVEVVLDGDGPRVTALLVGPGAWAPRLPAVLRIAARALFGGARVRVPLEKVERIDEAVVLRVPASEVGLGVLDRRIGHLFRGGGAS